VADQADWPRKGAPYGLPFFRDDAGEIRPGVVVMPAGGGDFWTAMAQDLRDASPRGYAKLLATYPNGARGLDLQPFFDLITIHELGHAFEGLEDRVMAVDGSQVGRLSATATDRLCSAETSAAVPLQCRPVSSGLKRFQAEFAHRRENPVNPGSAREERPASSYGGPRSRT
jgi:hypothetical protein